MIIIVPLAHPSYFEGKDSKSNKYINSKPLLIEVLQSRPWKNIYKSSEILFILPNLKTATTFYENKIKSFFPNSNSIYLSNISCGAAASVTAGLANYLNFHQINEEILIDLADISFKFSKEILDFSNLMVKNEALTFVFESDNKKYSFLSLNDKKEIINVLEKNICSNLATTGVYIFKNVNLFYYAFSEVLKNPKKYSFNNLFYIAPMLGALASKGFKVAYEKTIEVIDYDLVDY